MNNPTTTPILVDTNVPKKSRKQQREEKKIEKHLSELDKLLLDDCRKEKVLLHYRNDSRFLKHIIRALDLFLKARPDRIHEIVKTPRGGYTTNFILAGLLLNLKIMIVEPTNMIAENTINSAAELYEKITCDYSKIVRPLLSNEKVCKMLENVSTRSNDFYAPLFSPIHCDACEVDIYEPKEGERKYPLLLKNTEKYCTIKTMKHEKKTFEDEEKEYIPDLIAITYSKMEFLQYNSGKNIFFNELISKTYAILWDEFGKFVQNGSNGAMIWEEAVTPKGKVLHESSIDIMIGETREFVKKKYDKINESNRVYDNSHLILRFIENFIEPIVNISETLTKADLPSFHTNPLSQLRINIINKDGKTITVHKNEALSINILEYIDTIEVLRINAWGGKYANYLHSLVSVLTEDNFVLKSDIGDDYDDYNEDDYSLKPTDVSEINIETAKQKSITKSNRSLMKMFSSFMKKNQLTFISDATLPNIKINNIPGKKHVKEYFGDPVNTNKQCYVFQFKPKNLRIFGSQKWKKDKGDYRQYFIDLLTYVFSKIDIGNAFLIVPNKKIYKELLFQFKDIAVGVEYKDPPPDKLLITYYNSSMSRGVECDRRIGISLGVARKPMEAYLATIFGQGNLYDYADEAKLTEFAENEGMELEEFKELIEDFSNPKTNPDSGDEEIYHRVPDKLRAWFDHQGESLRTDVIAQDSKQGIDRCKDPSAIVRSSQIFIGVDDDSLKNLNEWGADVYYNVAMQKRAKSKDYKIEPCRTMQVSTFDLMGKWMKGENIDVMKYGHVLGLDKDFSLNLAIALMRRSDSSMGQGEAWANYERNENVHHKSENHHNGFFVGMIHICRKQLKSFGINIKNANNPYKTPYTFVLNKKFIVEKIVELTEVEKNALKVLHAAFITTKNEVTLSTMHMNDLALTDEQIIEAIDFMYENNYLYGSTWDFEEENGNLHIKKIRKGRINRAL